MTDIVYITVDSLRADHVGWHGYERETTPFLDELGETAHVFTNAFTHGCFTRQAFRAIMTGQFPTHCQEDGGLSDDCETIATLLSEAGYTNGGFHSNPHLLPQFGYARGFDHFYDSESEPSKTAKFRQKLKDIAEANETVFHVLERIFAQIEKTTGVNPGTPFVPGDELTDEAIEWVESTDEGPRFLWIHYMDVHHPYSPPEEYQREFRDEPISHQRAVKLRRKMVDKPENVTDSEFQDLVDLYDGEIRFVDAQVRRLVEAVRTHWGSDAVVAFTSDHGDEFREHGAFSHSETLYDELLNIPLLMQTGDEGGVHDDVVGLMDVPPTFLDYAGTENPGTFEGASLKPITAGQSREREYIIGDHGETIAYRDDTWKYITGPDRMELYNLEEDPGEQENVFEEYPEVIENIEQTLQQHPELRTEAETGLDKDDVSGEVQDRLEQLGYLQE
jgi:arylsulfatase A-like enzyme